MLQVQRTRAAAGDTQCVLLTGEPGVGKTRLLASAGVAARADGWYVLSGGAYELQGLSPYFPFVEALRGHLDRHGTSALERLAAPWRAPLGALIPELQPEGGPAQPDKSA